MTTYTVPFMMNNCLIFDLVQVSVRLLFRKHLLMKPTINSTVRNNAMTSVRGQVQTSRMNALINDNEMADDRNIGTTL